MGRDLAEGETSVSDAMKSLTAFLMGATLTLVVLARIGKSLAHEACGACR